VCGVKVLCIGHRMHMARLPWIKLKLFDNKREGKPRSVKEVGEKYSYSTFALPYIDNWPKDI
jgi:hypothetical protein